MSKHFRVEVQKEGRAWCAVDIQNPWSEEALRDVTRRFPAEEGFQVSIGVAVDERRLLESGPQGRLRLLASEPIFQPWNPA